MVPGFVLQPIVENAIRHGIGPRLAGGHVHVTAARSGSTLTLHVRDNGVGLPQGWPQQRDTGVGLRNVAARLEHVYGRPGLLRIEPAPGGGVAVRIDIPVDTTAAGMRQSEAAPA
jgi:sensor histidine kinase YesM